MKRIVITLLVLILGIVAYSQDTNIIIEKDTSLNYIADSLNGFSDDVKGLGDIIKQDYEDLGLVGFVRVYKGFIITGLIFIFLTILWFRSSKKE